MIRYLLILPLAAALWLPLKAEAHIPPRPTNACERALYRKHIFEHAMELHGKPIPPKILARLDARIARYCV